MTPEENFHFVSSFNARLGPVIRSNNGFINQYLGDSIMAIFPENPEDALRAAVGMQKAVHELNKERKEVGLPIIELVLACIQVRLLWVLPAMNSEWMRQQFQIR
jgi:class 3 adenylate cyclase